jgi:hypothetical protein
VFESLGPSHGTPCSCDTKSIDILDRCLRSFLSTDEPVWPNSRAPASLPPPDIRPRVLPLPGIHPRILSSPGCPDSSSTLWDDSAAASATKTSPEGGGAGVPVFICRAFSNLDVNDTCLGKGLFFLVLTITRRRGALRCAALADCVNLFCFLTS